MALHAAISLPDHRARCSAGRAGRSVPADQRYRAQYGDLSRKALAEAARPGITEEQYVELRKVAALVCSHLPQTAG